MQTKQINSRIQPNSSSFKCKKLKLSATETDKILTEVLKI